MLRFSRRMAWTASAMGWDWSASCRIDSTIFGQFLPPSYGVPLSAAIASFGSNRWMSRDLLVLDVPGEARRDHAVGGQGEALRDLGDRLAVHRVPSALRTCRLSKGGLVTWGVRYHVPGYG